MKHTQALGFLASDTLECVLARSLGWSAVHLWGRLGNAQRPRIRVCQTVMGKPWNVGNRTVRGSRTVSSPQAAGWARSGKANLTLWAGRSSWHAWWQLRAREATWSTSQTMRSSRKGRTGVGPHRDLGKVATQISGGDCLEP